MNVSHDVEMLLDRYSVEKRVWISKQLDDEFAGRLSDELSDYTV